MTFSVWLCSPCLKAKSILPGSDSTIKEILCILNTFVKYNTRVELIEKFSYFEFTRNMLSYFGLFLILFVEEGGIPLPVPGDIFIAAVSALPDSNYFLIVLTTASATLIGSTILFTLSHKICQPLIMKFG